MVHMNWVALLKDMHYGNVINALFMREIERHLWDKLHHDQSERAKDILLNYFTTSVAVISFLSQLVISSHCAGRMCSPIQLCMVPLIKIHDCHTKRYLMFVIPKGIWCLSYQKVSDVCHTQMYLMFVIPKGTWCQACYDWYTFIIPIGVWHQAY